MPLSNPLVKSLSSIFIAILLDFLASGPDPIPSLIANKYFPSSKIVFVYVSPDIGDLSFTVFAIPNCNV